MAANRPLDVESSSGADSSSEKGFAQRLWNVGEKAIETFSNVSASTRTHRNYDLPADSAPVAVSTDKHNDGFKLSAAVGWEIEDKPPRQALVGHKWLVEYQSNRPSIVISKTQLDQIVYIFMCQDCIVHVKGKVHSVVLDSCKRTKVFLDSVVASVDFVNCQSVEIAAENDVPAISINKTDGCKMFLDADYMDVFITTAKSSRMTLMVATSEGNYIECPVAGSGITQHV